MNTNCWCILSPGHPNTEGKLERGHFLWYCTVHQKNRSDGNWEKKHGYLNDLSVWRSLSSQFNVILSPYCYTETYFRAFSWVPALPWLQLPGFWLAAGISPAGSQRKEVLLHTEFHTDICLVQLCSVFLTLRNQLVRVWIITWLFSRPEPWVLVCHALNLAAPYLCGASSPFKTVAACKSWNKRSVGLKKTREP